MSKGVSEGAPDAEPIADRWHLLSNLRETLVTLLEKKPGAERLTLLTEYRQFWRESNQDAVYTSSGSILRASGGSNASSIGGEMDLQVNWQIDRHISAYAGYSHFFHGSFITDTGPHSDINFAYSALTFTF